MYEKVLSKDAKESLALLTRGGILESFYLAGGTALALQLGHRYSFDFDFFAPQEFDEERLLQRMASAFSHFRLERRSWGTISGYLGKSRLSLFSYRYPLLFKTHQFLEIEVADLKDIVPMKIAAVADRGTKRDFIDLYFAIAEAKALTIKEALRLYEKKYRSLKQNKVHILKSLVCFEDAERDPLPRMIKPVRWRSVKDFFLGQQKVAKEILKME